MPEFKVGQLLADKGCVKNALNRVTRTWIYRVVELNGRGGRFAIHEVIGRGCPPVEHAGCTYPIGNFEETFDIIPISLEDKLNSFMENG